MGKFGATTTAVVLLAVVALLPTLLLPTAASTDEPTMRTRRASSPAAEPRHGARRRTSLRPPPVDLERGGDGDRRPLLRQFSEEAAAAVVSGYAFYDGDDDGVRDPVGDWGIYGLHVHLSPCEDDDEVVRNATTDALGYYRFDGLSMGSYRLSLTDMPAYYDFFAISDRWAGVDPESESAIDPETGRTACFFLERGATETVSFATKLADDGDDAPSSPESTAAGSIGGSDERPSGGGRDDVDGGGRDDAPSPPLAAGSDEEPLTMVDATDEASSPEDPPTYIPSYFPTKFPTPRPVGTEEPSYGGGDGAATEEPSYGVFGAGGAATLPPDLPIPEPPPDPPTLDPTPSPSDAPSGSPGPTDTASDAPSAPPSFTSGPTTLLRPSGVPSVPPSTTVPSGPPSPSPTGAPSETITGVPSGVPTVGPSSAPSETVTGVPSGMPSSSAVPTSAPSAPPTRTGKLLGPLRTDDFVMTIRGIDRLEDLEGWQAGTSAFIMDYFNRTGTDPGAFDVTASLEVVKQRSSNDTLFEEGKWLRGRNDDEYDDPVLGKDGGRERELQRVKSVEVTFSLIASYRTANFAEYDFAYVATRPFNGRRESERYLRTLRTFSPVYEGVTSVGSIRVKPPTDDDDLPEVRYVRSDDGGGMDNRTISIIVAAAGGVALCVYLTVAVTVKRRRARRRRLAELSSEDEEELEDDLDKSEMAEDEGSEGSLTDDDLERGDPDDDDDDDSASEDGDGDGEESLGRTRTIVVSAPAGKLGVVVDAAPDGGPAYVARVKPASPVADKIRPDDRVLAVDDEDVRDMSPTKISRLLARKSDQEERRITLERRFSYGDDKSEGSDDDDDDDDDKSEGSDGDDYSDKGDDLASAAVGTGETWYSEGPVSDDDGGDDGSLIRTIDVYVPAGRLGLVLDSPLEEEGGAAYVCEVKDHCPVADQIMLDDEIVAVDGEDVLGMDALEVSRLLAEGSRRPGRTITVERRLGGGAGTASYVSEERSDAYSDDFTYDDASRGTDRALRGSPTGTDWTPRGSPTRTREVDVLLPAGKLGIVLDDPPDGGPATVCEIRDICPVADQIRLGDKILAVDGEEVSTLGALGISRLLARKSRQLSGRRITVERRVDGAGAAPYREESDGARETPNLAPERALRKIRTVDVLLPAGRLGIVLDAPPNGGTAYVSEVKNDCPVAGQVQLGDKILAVDEEEVLSLGPPEISQLLASKSRQSERKIMVSRRVSDSESDAAGATNPYLNVNRPVPKDDGLELSLITMDPSSSSLHPIKEISSGEGQRIDLVAPPGRLGVMLVTPEPPLPPGLAYVFNIREDSPLKGKVRFRDKILAVDDEDVTKMSAINISMLLGEKSSNKQRKITILREAPTKGKERRMA